MTNPFGSWQVGTLAPGAGLPVSMLAQSAVAGTVDDRITEHADDLFAVLDERGEAAWKECAALLTQFILSTGHYGAGADAAERYLAQQPAPSPELPVLTALHRLNAVCIRQGIDAAKGFLLVQPDWLVRGVTRYQFCVAVGCSGYPREQYGRAARRAVRRPGRTAAQVEVRRAQVASPCGAGASSPQV